MADICEEEKGPGHLVSEGKNEGKYPLLRSSISNKVKWLDTYDHIGPNIIIGTGGNFNIHYRSKFSVSGGYGGGGKMLVLKIKDSCEFKLKLLYYILDFKAHIISEMYKGSGLKHLDKKMLYKHKIPLPSLEIQQQLIQIFEQRTKTIEDIQNKINNEKDYINELNELAKNIIRVYC